MTAALAAQVLKPQVSRTFITLTSAFYSLAAALALTLCSNFLQAQPEESRQDFSAWLEDFKAEARRQGISSDTLALAFEKVQAPIERVLELDHSQPEFMQTFSGYLNNRMSQARIERGRQLIIEHGELFDRIRRQYGIQPHYLVSFWALESNFGDYTGGFSVINALATLAYDPRRADMFRKELLTALQIIQQGHIAADRMSGSWAGAMGQCQFMPSTFMSYAKDGDGDGKIDIWNSIPDVMTSAANFLSASGWKGDERWGREVLLPDNFDFELSGTSVRKTVTEWNQLGIRRIDGASLGQADMPASLIVPAGAKGPAFLTYNNFRTTMVWNRSIFYAIAVGHLADRYVGGIPLQGMPVGEERPLARNDVMEMQSLLNEHGIDVGSPDGILGSKTRAGVREFQLRNNLTADGYASYDFLSTLRATTL